MSESATLVSPHRATILIGYGEFGLTIQRRLLSSAAPRGVLAWQEPHGGASERHLEDLGLLCLPDREVGPEWNPASSDALEMMRDLHQQIEKVGDGSSHDADAFAEKLSEAAEKLLSVAARAGRSDALPVGLDVIVVAQPTTPDMIGKLDRLLARGMDRLANNTNLERAVQGADALSFISFLDFDNYWARSEEGRGLRDAVRNSIEQWQSRRAAHRPAFGRIYLVNRYTDDGTRDESHRIDEIVLFLEFLLFEGQRDGPLQRLYQGPLDMPVATFGIRLMERSAGLLRRLAAARFGIGWLQYLAGDGAYHGREPVDLRTLLAQYRPDALDLLVDEQALRRLIDIEMLAAQQELLQLPVTLADWPQRVRGRYEQALRRLEGQISKSARQSMAQIATTQLVPFPDDLRKAVEADLHHPQEPVPLGQLVVELQRSVDQLDSDRDDGSPPSPEPAEALRDIQRRHAAFRSFNDERIQVEGLKRWWPLFALVLSGGLTPIAHDLLTDVPKPDPLKFLLNQAFNALQWLNKPLIIGTLLFFAAWGLGAIALHRRIAARVDYARRYYSDAERGRFAGILRRCLGPGGELRRPIDAFVDRIVLDMTLSVRGEATRELRRVLDRLLQRAHEIDWLRGELRKFLRMYGIAREDLKADDGPLARGETAAFRYTVEQGEDLERMVARNAQGQERFRAAQASLRPFAGWEERYSRAFLAPLEFLDHLSRDYADPFERELAQPGAGDEQKRVATDLRKFLHSYGSFSLAFSFRAQQGVPPERLYCLLPQPWSQLGVMRDLKDLGMPDDAVMRAPDTGRAYLLRIQTGIDPKCVVES